MTAYQDGRWDVKKLRDDGYRTGSVLRVKMVNFITYDHAEVFPGPRLNVVLGPNGTGKSTITHAMCLACGGNPRALSRANDLSTFVKTGTPADLESSVEVDLLKHHTVATVKRIISHKDNTSKWMLNRSPATKTQVDELMKSLSIDMSNICSFMPQDRVGEFSRMTPKELLQKTLEAIKLNDDETFYEAQKRLSDVESAKNQQAAEVNTKRATRDNLKVQLDNIAMEVERMDARREAVASLARCEAKLAVSEFEAAVTANDAAKEECVRAEGRLSEARNAIAPLEVAERDLRIELSTLDDDIATNQRQFKQCDTALRNQREAIDTLDVEVENATNELASLDTKREENTRRLHTLQAKKASFEKELEKAREQVPMAQEKLKVIEVEETKEKGQLQLIQESIEELNENLSRNTEEVKAKQQQITSLRDVTALYREKLIKAARGPGGEIAAHSLKAMEWLQQNKHKFKEEVVGPVSLHLNIRDPAIAAMVEKAVPWHRLFMFLVTCEEDREVFRKELRERQRLKVDVTLIGNVDQEFHPGYTRDQMEYLRSLGVQGTLLSAFDCPAIVRNYLCSFMFIHQVLWARISASNERDRNHALGQLTSNDSLRRVMPQGKFKSQLFVDCSNSSNHSSSSSSSRGGGSNQLEIIEYQLNKSKHSRSDDISTARLQIEVKDFLGAMDNSADGRKAHLEEEIRTLHQQRREIEGALGDERSKQSEHQNNMKQIKEAKQQLRQRLQQPEMIEHKIKEVVRELKQVEKQLSSDMTQERARLVRAYEDKVSESVRAIAQVGTLIQQLATKRMEGAAIEKRKVRLTEQQRAAADALRAAKATLQEFTTALNAARRARDEAQRKYTLAEDALNALVESKGGEDPFTTYYQDEVLAKCPFTTLDDLRANIDLLQQQIEMIVDNPEVLRRHQQLKQQLEAAEKEVTASEGMLANAEDDLKKQASEWAEGVEHVVKNLGNKFEAYMQALQYQGRLWLRQTGKIIDYEMVIEVGFRGDGERAELSGARHSGGERAVSTIMYLMALQSMTSAPFRVVDEINQGMDDRNERLVFSRIVESCCRPTLPPTEAQGNANVHSTPPVKLSQSSRSSSSSKSSLSQLSQSSSTADNSQSQYFLVSPKLLQGLKALAHDDVTVLLVLNGPGLLLPQQRSSSSSSSSSSRHAQAAAAEAPLSLERMLSTLKRKFNYVGSVDDSNTDMDTSMNSSLNSSLNTSMNSTVTGASSPASTYSRRTVEDDNDNNAVNVKKRRQVLQDIPASSSSSSSSSATSTNATTNPSAPNPNPLKPTAAASAAATVPSATPATTRAQRAMMQIASTKTTATGTSSSTSPKQRVQQTLEKMIKVEKRPSIGSASTSASTSAPTSTSSTSSVGFSNGGFSGPNGSGSGSGSNHKKREPEIILLDSDEDDGVVPLANSSTSAEKRRKQQHNNSGSTNGFHGNGNGLGNGKTANGANGVGHVNGRSSSGSNGSKSLSGLDVIDLSQL